MRVAQRAPQRPAAARYAALCLLQHGARWPVEISEENLGTGGFPVGIL